jgi:integrase
MDSIAAIESIGDLTTGRAIRCFLARARRKVLIPDPGLFDVLRGAGIADYVWHSNRHTFCSRLATAGASIKEIQELAGHNTIAMSARCSHLPPDHRSSVIDRISENSTQ